MANWECSISRKDRVLTAPPGPDHSPYHGGHYLPMLGLCTTQPPPPPGPIYSSYQGLIVPLLGPSGACLLSPAPLVGYGGLLQSAPPRPTTP